MQEYKILKDEEGNHIEDGSVKHFEARTSLVGVDLALGYINTNKKGIGAMDSFGDNIDPTEELGAYDYEDTYYGAIAYNIADIELSVLYKGFYDYQVNCKDTPSSLPFFMSINSFIY